MGKAKQRELSPHGPAFAAAPRPAVCRMPRPGAKKFGLPWIWQAFKLKYQFFHIPPFPKNNMGADILRSLTVSHHIDYTSVNSAFQRHI
ncbi:MAG: hypothetical protein PUC76_03375 [Clostridia bacterium]|nr:hypothetical protein [Clostridia bacterium]